MARRLATLRSLRARYGFGSTLRLLIDRFGSRLFGLMIAHVVWLEAGEVMVAAAATTPAFTFRFLTPGEVAEFARDPANELEPEFACRAADGRNCCFAALDGDRLAAYGWYAREWIEPEHCFGFGLRMPADVAYMYKGFTHPDYRGLRLHGAVMGLALRAMEPQGIRALVSTVQWTNDASLRSCDRLGYRRIGKVIRVQIAGRSFLYAAARVRRRGVEIVRHNPPTTQRLTIV